MGRWTTLSVWIAALVTAACVLTSSPMATARSQPLPALPALPIKAQGVHLQIGTSARVELLQVLLATGSRQALSLDTPQRAKALRSLTRLSSADAVRRFRELEAQGLPPEQWLALVLSHGEPPRLSPFKPVDRWAGPWGLELSPRDREKMLTRATSSLKDLWEEAELAAYFEEFGQSYRELEGALRQALPGDAPADELAWRLGGEGPAVVLVPSHLALKHQAAWLPGAEGGRPTLVVIAPLPPGGLPDQPLEQAALRYEPITRARLDPLFAAWSAELGQIARAINETRPRPTAGGGIALELSRDGIFDEEKLRQSVVRALYHRSLGPVPADLKQAEWSARRRGLMGVGAMARALEQLDATPQEVPDLSVALPLLLEAALADARASGASTPPDGRFEVWEGTTPVGWTVAADSVGGANARPSIIERHNAAPQPVAPAPVRGRRPPPPPPAPPPNWAVRMAADAGTAPFQYLLSEPLRVRPGDRVLVTGRIRTRDVQPAASHQVAGAYLFVVQQGGEGVVIRRTIGKALTGTNDWQEQRVDLIVPAGSASVRVGMGLGMAGEALFDDVTIAIEPRASQTLLHHGGFEVASGDGVLGWETALVAQSPVVGPSRASEVNQDTRSFAQGKASVSIRGDAQTADWMAPRTPPIESRPGRRVTLTAQVKTEGVRHEGLQTRAANLKLEFLNERGAVIGSASSPTIEGTTRWTAVKLEAVAPIDTVWVRASCALTMSGTLWCDDAHLWQR